MLRVSVANRPAVRLRGERNQLAILRLCVAALQAADEWSEAVEQRIIDSLVAEGMDATNYPELRAVCSRYCKLR